MDTRPGNYSFMLPKKDLGWLQPYDVKDLIRIGRDRDGGYLTTQRAVDAAETLLAMGLGPEWSFEQRWKELFPRHTVHIYDGTNPMEFYSPEEISAYRAFFNGVCAVHHQKNVGATSTSEIASFAECLANTGCDQVFLKCDIEGAEYEFIPELVKYAKHVTGIVFEMHWCNNNFQRFAQAMQLLNTEYKVVHFHGNSYTPNGWYGLTDAMEVSLVRKDLCPETELRTKVFMPDLDSPSIPNGSEWEYYFDSK